MEPGELSGSLVDRLERITEAVPVDGSADGVPDEQLAAAAVELGDLEQEVSSLRRAMFDRIDAVQAELTRRYRDGEAQVDDLLAGDD
jgi:phage host-nuclease inhibitor protein Gam